MLPPTSSKIRLEHLIQVYGDKPHIALQQFRSGQSRASILETTGQIIGVADVSLDIQQGELFVIMGLSGSGKSTLIRCMNRLIQPISGHLYLDNQDLLRLDAQQMRQIRATQISMVFKRFSLFPHRTVLKNVEYGLAIQNISPQQRQHQAQEMLTKVGLGDRAHSYPDQLSGGMQQRVGLARALATGAEILLMDEPFSALDPLIRRDMQAELLQLQKKFHKTIVFVSHDIHEALKLGDRIAVMRDGQIVQVGTPHQILTEPVDDYVRAFTQDIRDIQALDISLT